MIIRIILLSAISAFICLSLTAQTGSGIYSFKGDGSDLSDAYDAIATHLYPRVSKDTLALEFQKARTTLSDAIERNDRNGTLEASHLLGTVYERKREFNLAIECYRIYETHVTDSISKAHILRDIAICLYQQAKYDKSIDYLNRSLSYDNRITNTLICKTFLCWADFYQHRYDNFIKAYINLSEAAGPFLNEHYKDWMNTTSAMYHIAIKDYETAQSFLSDITNQEQKMRIEEVMFSLLGYYGKALFCHDRVNAINDSIRNLAYDQNNDEVSMLVETSNRLSKFKGIQKRNIIITESILVISLILILGWTLYHSMARLKAYREQKALNKKLQKEKERAAKLEKMQSLFITNMSREIKTPIHTIVNASRNLTLSQMEDKQKIYALCENISEATSYILRIINHIFTVSSAQSSDLPEKSTFPMDFLISSILTQASNQLGHAAEVNVSIGNMDKITADFSSIVNVQSNLLTHMCHSSGNGNVSMTFSIMDDKLEFRVEGNGGEAANYVVRNAFDQFENDSALNASILELSSAIIQARADNNIIYQDKSYRDGARIITSFPLFKTENQ